VNTDRVLDAAGGEMTRLADAFQRDNLRNTSAGTEKWEKEEYPAKTKEEDVKSSGIETLGGIAR